MAPEACNGKFLDPNHDLFAAHAELLFHLNEPLIDLGIFLSCILHCKLAILQNQYIVHDRTFSRLHIEANLSQVEENITDPSFPEPGPQR
jgi:hypothetical protein